MRNIASFFRHKKRFFSSPAFRSTNNCASSLFHLHLFLYVCEVCVVVSPSTSESRDFTIYLSLSLSLSLSLYSLTSFVILVISKHSLDPHSFFLTLKVASFVCAEHFCAFPLLRSLEFKGFSIRRVKTSRSINGPASFICRSKCLPSAPLILLNPVISRFKSFSSVVL